MLRALRRSLVALKDSNCLREECSTTSGTNDWSVAAGNRMRSASLSKSSPFSIASVRSPSLCDRHPSPVPRYLSTSYPLLGRWVALPSEARSDFCSPGHRKSKGIAALDNRDLPRFLTGRLYATSSSYNGPSSAPSASTGRQSTPIPPSRELQAIRGVGPVNASLLLAKRITSVQRLQEIYHIQCREDKEELTRYLTEKVGFRNPAHSRSVADHLADLPWAPPAMRAKLAVEGNIGAGKSTFLSCLAGPQGSLELQDIVEIVPEPVEEWQSVTRGGGEAPINLLERFYEDPAKYAYTFQHYVLLTRMQKDRLARSSSKPIRVLERSIFSDRMVFVRAMHEAGYLGDLELSVYDSWFSMEIEQDRGLLPDGFIYLKARPDTCMQRLKMRNRSEEAGVDREYLENLHEKHESWLYAGAQALKDYLREAQLASTPADQSLLRSISKLQRTKHGLEVSPEILQLARRISEDGQEHRLQLYDETVVELLKQAPDCIRDSIMFLGRPKDGTNNLLSASGLQVYPGGAGLGSSVARSPGLGRGGTEEDRIMGELLCGVPALVLDHDQSDILHDPDAREDYARKVKAFSEYVNSIRSVRSDIIVGRGYGNSGDSMGSRSAGATLSSSSSLVLPRDEGEMASQLDHVQRLVGEYRRYVEMQKKSSAQCDASLRGLENLLDNLMASMNAHHGERLAYSKER